VEGILVAVRVGTLEAAVEVYHSLVSHDVSVVRPDDIRRVMSARAAPALAAASHGEVS
jgi:hypothetical protein